MDLCVEFIREDRVAYCRSVLGLAQWAELRSGKACLYIEVVFPIGVQVFVTGRRQVGKILVTRRISLGLKLIDSRTHIDRVPGHYSIGKQIQTACLIVLLLLLLPSNLSPVGEERVSTRLL